MSSIRGTTRSGSNSSRALKEPSTEPALAELAGPVTSVKGKRSKVGSRADRKVAPAWRCLTRAASGNPLPSEPREEMSREQPHGRPHRFLRGAVGPDPPGSLPELHGDVDLRADRAG